MEVSLGEVDRYDAFQSTVTEQLERLTAWEKKVNLLAYTHPAAKAPAAACYSGSTLPQKTVRRVQQQSQEQSLHQEILLQLGDLLHALQTTQVGQHRLLLQQEPQRTARELQQLQMQAEARASVVTQLEDERTYLQEAKNIAAGILRMRKLQKDLESALECDDLVCATIAATRVEETRKLFESIDARYASGVAAAFSAASGRSSDSIEPVVALSVSENAILRDVHRQQQQLVLRLKQRLIQAVVVAAARSVVMARSRDFRDDSEQALPGISEKSQQQSQHASADAILTVSTPNTEQKEQLISKWREELRLNIGLLTALERQQEALRCVVQQLRAQLADDAAKRFKVLLQSQKQQQQQQSLEQLQPNSSAMTGEQDRMLHVAALGQLEKAAAGVIHRQIKVLGAAAAAPLSIISITGSGYKNKSAEGASAVLYALLSLRHEVDIQGVRILNHFSDCKADALATSHQSENLSLARLRIIDRVLLEMVALSACCMRIHRCFKNATAKANAAIALSAQLQHSNSNLIQLQQNHSNGVCSKSGSSSASESASNSSRSSDCTGLATTAAASLVELARREGAFNAQTYRMWALMKRREELMAEYVGLENVFVTSSVYQALNVADELPQQTSSGNSSSSLLGSAFTALHENHVTGDHAYAEEDEEDDDRFYSTLVDDVFFILNKSVLRAIASGDVLAACAVVNNICSVLSGDVKAKLRANLEESKILYGNYVSREHHVNCYSLAECLQMAAAQRQDAPFPVRPGSSFSWPHSVNNVSLTVQTLKKFKARVALEFERKFALHGLQYDAATTQGITEVEADSHSSSNNKKIELEKLTESDNADDSSGGTSEFVDEYDDETVQYVFSAPEGSATSPAVFKNEEGSDIIISENTAQSSKLYVDTIQNCKSSSSAATKERHRENDFMMFECTLQAVDGVVEQLQHLHERCCKVTVRLLQSHLLRGFDALHEAVYDSYETARTEDGPEGNKQMGLGYNAEKAFALQENTDGHYVDEKRQERWRLLLQRGTAVILNHIGRLYDRASQSLACSLLLQLIANRMEMLLLDKSYTAVGGLQLSGQLRRFLQQLSMLQHHQQRAEAGSYGSSKRSAAEASVIGPSGRFVLPGSSVFGGGAAAASTCVIGSAADIATTANGPSSLLGVIAAAAAVGMGRDDHTGSSLEEGEGEFALSRVCIFCDVSVRPKFWRLLEITELLSLGSLDELLEIWGPSSGKFWRLSVDEMKKVLERRAEFSKDDIESFFKEHRQL